MSDQPITGPSERPDSAPPHQNPIRRFREELRLTRSQFARLVGVGPDTLRLWERNGTGGKQRATKPKGEAAVTLLELAHRNYYPLTMQDIYSMGTSSAKSAKKETKKTTVRRTPKARRLHRR